MASSIARTRYCRLAVVCIHDGGQLACEPVTSSIELMERIPARHADN